MIQFEAENMTPQRQPKLKRRGILRACARFGIALGAVLGGAALAKRNGGRLDENACRDPRGRTGCGTCRLLEACRLPRGLSYKQVRKDSDYV